MSCAVGLRLLALRVDAGLPENERSDYQGLQWRLILYSGAMN